MQGVIIDIRTTESSIKSNKLQSVNFRNDIEIANCLGFDYCFHITELNFKKQYDIIIFSFGSISSEYPHTIRFIENNPNAKLIFISGEYEQQTYPPLWKSKRKYYVIKNYETKGKLAGIGTRVIKTFDLNLNLLIIHNSNELTTKKYDCIYYGRWRPDRKNYFRKYIQKGIYLSTTIKNMKKFKNAGCNPNYIDKIIWTSKKETLNNFKYSLYIEDVYTHKVFNNLANRWYEAGFCNNVVFFDINCWNTIKKSEIAAFEDQIKDYIVTDYNSLQEKINYCNLDFEKHLAIQKTWRLQEPLLKQELIENIKKIIINEIR
jgi:hypothetical protein